MVREQGQHVGYIRVSTLDQNTERQLDGIELAKVFTDKSQRQGCEEAGATSDPQLFARGGHLDSPLDGPLGAHTLDLLCRLTFAFCRAACAA